MKKYDLIFITTFIDTKMIGHLLQSVTLNRDIDLFVVLVAQNGIRIDTAPYASEHTEFHVISVSGQLNSSAGRNVGIDYIVGKSITSAYVMFPDDDSSFDESFFLHFRANIDRSHGYLTNVYETSSRNYFKRVHPSREGIFSRKSWNMVGTCNMLITYDVFLCTGRFDETMGVGAQYGAGEDADYFMRTLEVGGKYRYNEHLYSFHPSGVDRYKQMSYTQLLSRFRTYGEGVIYMLCKHKLYRSALIVIFRAVGGGIIHLFKLNFKMSRVYFYAFGSRGKMFLKCLFDIGDKL